MPTDDETNRSNQPAGSIPVAAIVAFYGPSAPPGWLLCNGDPIPPVHHQLIAVVGRTTPDFRGYFLRGYDPAGAIDPDGTTRGIGSPQPDLVKEHSHQYSRSYIGSAGKSGGDRPDVAAYQDSPMTSSASAGLGVETRPNNKAVNFIIKT